MDLGKGHTRVEKLGSNHSTRCSKWSPSLVDCTLKSAALSGRGESPHLCTSVSSSVRNEVGQSPVLVLGPLNSDSVSATIQLSVFG